MNNGAWRQMNSVDRRWMNSAEMHSTRWTVSGWTVSGWTVSRWTVSRWTVSRWTVSIDAIWAVPIDVGWIMSIDTWWIVSIDAWISTLPIAALRVSTAFLDLWITHSKFCGSISKCHIPLLLLVLICLYLNRSKKNLKFFRTIVKPILNLSKQDLMAIKAPRQWRQIWYHSNYPKEWFILSQIRGRVVVLRDRIHRELRHTKDLIVIWLN